MANLDTAISEPAATPGTNKALTGLFAAALTPLNEDLTPNSAGTVAHVKWLLESGCHGVALFGTTGEANSFSTEERMAVLDAVAEAGVPGDRLLVGTGCCALSDSVQLSAHAIGHGYRNLLMLPPFYYKGVSDEGLFHSYAETIERVGEPNLAIYLYHFPKLSGVPITHGLIELLLKAYPETIVGLKDSSGDAEGCAAYLESFPDLAIFPGSEMLKLDMLKRGGAGCITATANVNPAHIREVYEAFLSGDMTTAQARQDEISATRKVIQATPMIPTLKYIMAGQRSESAWLRMRPPMMPLTAEQGASLDSELVEAAFRFGAG